MPVLYSDPNSINNFSGKILTEGSIDGAKNSDVTVASVAGLFNQLSFLNLSPKNFSIDAYVKTLHEMHVHYRDLYV